MFKLSVALFAATLAIASAFLSSRIATCSVRVESSKLFSDCADKVRDANGRCPGDAGYRPVLREAPSDFASYLAAQKAAKAGGASPAGRSSVSSSPAPAARAPVSYGSRPSASSPAPASPAARSPVSYGASPSGKKDERCADKVRDANGRCPGDAGYRPVLREAPSDFASYLAAQKGAKAPSASSSVSSSYGSRPSASSPAPAARAPVSYGSRPSASSPAPASPAARSPVSYGASPSGKKDERCADKVRDANGRCPGDAGYRPVLREAPSDFASYLASQRARK